MSYFKGKMNQIRFWLGLRPRPRWGSSQRSPNPLAECNGSNFYSIREMEGRKGKRRGRKDGKGMGSVADSGGEGAKGRGRNGKGAGMRKRGKGEGRGGKLEQGR